MYEINLIHEKIIPISQQRTRLSVFSLYLLIWAITGVVVAYFIMTTEAEIESYTSAVRRLEARNALPGGITKDDVTILGRQLQASQATLTSVQQQTLLWAPKLARLRSYLPKDAWLNRLLSRRSTTAFANKGGGPPVPLGEVVIEGMILIPENTAIVESLEQFVSQLRQDKTFMEHIANLNHLVVGRERYGGREVVSFVIVCVIEQSVRFDA